MNYAEYSYQKSARDAQVQIKRAAREYRPKDKRIFDISKCFVLFYDNIQTYYLMMDQDIQQIELFWNSIHKQRSFGSVVIKIVKTIDQIISEIQEYKERHQRLVDKYYLTNKTITDYINMVVQLGYLDLIIPDELKEPDC